MSTQKPETVSNRKPDSHRPQPNPDEKWEQTDRSRTGEGSGATGGGSLGNLPGTPETGGSPEFGPNEKRPQGPASETAGKRNRDKD